MPQRIRKLFVAGNWKMNGFLSDVSELLEELLSQLVDFSAADVVVFPAFVHLPKAHEFLEESSIAYGGQNLSEYDKGAFTGEISAPMLQDLGCRYVIVGHSERRHLYHESNELVAEKFAKALEHDLMPVLCVGETQEEREHNQTESIIADQINAVIEKNGIESFQNAVIAYEPVWAIGTGLTATPDQAQAVHVFIRQLIARHDETIAEQIRIIYGGSVKASNAAELFAMPDIDGGLVGGASLKADEFARICLAAGLFESR